VSRRTRSSAEEISEPPVNLTPLIDVVFVILIIFIVIAPLLELDHITLADSSQGADKVCLSVEECSPIAIQVHANNEVWLNGKKVELVNLQQHLVEAKGKFPGATPQVFHDKRAHFGTYQSIKNAAELAGFNKIDVVLKP
jgi:biopolymer transport protein ExbD